MRRGQRCAIASSKVGPSQPQRDETYARGGGAGQAVSATQAVVGLSIEKQPACELVVDKVFDEFRPSRSRKARSAAERPVASSLKMVQNGRA